MKRTTAVTVAVAAVDVRPGKHVRLSMPRGIWYILTDTVRHRDGFMLLIESASGKAHYIDPLTTVWVR